MSGLQTPQELLGGLSRKLLGIYLLFSKRGGSFPRKNLPFSFRDPLRIPFN